MGKQGGITLVLVSGLLGLLLLLATSLHQLAFLQGAAGGQHLDQVTSRLRVEDALEYAAARLVDEGYPRSGASISTRGDEWGYRDGLPVPLAGCRNPSYAHGEPWVDDGDGAWEPGEAFTDIDGDGRFSARSGRLRGADGLFALKIDCQEGRLPVNAGYLGGEPADLDHDGLFDGTGDDRDADNVPDWRDPDVHPYHRGIAHALNNLGALVLPADCPRLDRDVKTGPGGIGYTFRFSWLGDDLVRNRPKGGYRNWEQVVSVLMGLPDAPPASSPYRPQDLAVIRSYLNLGPYAAGPDGRRSAPEDGQDFPHYVPVNLSLASVETLQALWMHLSATVWIPGGEPQATAVHHRRPQASWTDFLFGTMTRAGSDDTRLILYDDEARLLALRAAALRGSLPLSWKAFYEAVLAEKETIFGKDVEDVAQASAPAPLFLERLLRTKTDMAIQAVTEDPRPLIAPLYDDVWTFSGWPSWDACGIDGSAEPNVQAYGSPFGWIGRVPYPAGPGVGYGLDWDLAYLNQVKLKPQGMTLAPPGVYRIEALGRSGTAHLEAERGFRAHERLVFSSQEDFENLSAGLHLAGRGITTAPEDEATWRARHDVYPDGLDGAEIPHVVSLPSLNRRMFAGDLDGQKAPYYGFSRVFGALALPNQASTGGDLDWPLREDYDGILNAPGTDFWHRNASAPAPAAPLGTSMSGMAYEVTHAAGYRSPEYGQQGIPGSGLAVPGFYGETVVQAASISGWIVPAGAIALAGTDGIEALYVSLHRGDFDDPDRVEEGLTVMLYLYWRDDTGVYHAANPRWFVKEPAARESCPAHVLLDIAKEGTGTRFTACLNGQKDDAAGDPMTHFHPYSLRGVDDLFFLAGRARMIAFSGQVTGPVRAAAIWADGRNVLEGTWRSPLCVFDRPTRVRDILPHAFTAADGGGAVFLHVTGYADASGSILAWDKTFDATIPYDSQDSPPAVRSLRYEVHLTRQGASLADGYDSPVFESVSFGLSRPGRAPCWLDTGQN